MSVIFKTKTCTLKKNSNKFTLNYENGEKFPNFFEKLKKKLKITKEKKGKSFTFEGISVESLPHLLSRKGTLSYRHLKHLFLDIGKQLEGLEKDNFGHLFFRLEDIVRVELDETTQEGGTGKDISFLYLNTDNFLPLNDKFLTISRPFDKSKLFFSPEMKNINHFPVNIPISSQFYGLSLLVSFCLRKDDTKIKVLNLDNFRQYLSSIENTKLYWALLRCLQLDPDDRVYLFI